MSIWGEHLDKEELRRNDPELYNFLVEYERTGGKMEETEPQKTKARKKPIQRVRMTNLTGARAKKHITQTDLARTSGVSIRSITAIENGRSAPSVFAALALANALDARVEDLFYIGPPEPPADAFTTGRAMIFK